uniref:Two component, sigma54 specific, transcriptional regulator, Fis family n=1 Tax=Nitratidesulfovibrio vulgaris (strain DSM 19637 / Miyazaki F) TaxID=883 RepID=B8DQZ7_NITV9
MPEILIIDDDPLVAETLADLAEDMGHVPLRAASLADGLAHADAGFGDVVLLDVMMPDGNGLEALPRFVASPPRPEVIIITGANAEQSAEMAVRNGAWDYITKGAPVSSIRLAILRALEFRNEKLARTAQQGRQFNPAGLVGTSPAFMECLDLVAKAAHSDVPVLITGETGTGKELAARAIHENSDRAGRPFVVVDCAALPENLTESVLFGHVRGAFTGADRDAEGLIRQASGGTLFLDEIGELSPTLQKTFLRVLQERRFRPVGGRQEVECDFRLLAATNRDLSLMVRRGEFREDLLYRVRSMHIALPPLRQREDDLRPLSEHFVHQYCERNNLPSRILTQELLRALVAHHWPGNVRELRNTMETMIAFAGGVRTLYPVHLPEHIRVRHMRATAEGMRPDHTGHTDHTDHAESDSPDLPLAGLSIPTWMTYRDVALERAAVDYFQNLLAYAGGDMAKAQQLSGLSRAQFYRLLRKLR